ERVGVVGAQHRRATERVAAVDERARAAAGDSAGASEIARGVDGATGRGAAAGDVHGGRGGRDIHGSRRGGEQVESRRGGVKIAAVHLQVAGREDVAGGSADGEVGGVHRDAAVQ